MFVVEILMLFIVVLAGNQMGYAGRWNLPLGKVPVSTWLLGGHKTIGAYYAGTLFGASAMLLEYPVPTVPEFFGLSSAAQALTTGGLIGLGVVVGDHTNSFIKRRRDLEPGHPTFSDRFDWTLSGGCVAWLLCPQVTWEHVLVLTIIGYPVHVFGNRHSYSRGWRDTPH